MFFLFKVAVHSFVENLFRSIWGMPHCRAPHAVKYFFDFLDAQAESMKIGDPDVLHIWKTNRYKSSAERRKSVHKKIKEKVRTNKMYACEASADVTLNKSLLRGLCPVTVCPCASGSTS